MKSKAFLFLTILLTLLSGSFVNAQKAYCVKAEKINPTTIKILTNNNTSIFVDFYGENIFRYFQDMEGNGIRNPGSKP